MPSYEHLCADCNVEFEEFYSMNDPLPPCPKCKGTNIKRLISGGSGRGIVELTGQDLKKKIKQDIKEMKHKMRTDENFRANLQGEDTFHKMVK